MKIRSFFERKRLAKKKWDPEKTEHGKQENSGGGGGGGRG